MDLLMLKPPAAPAVMTAALYPSHQAAAKPLLLVLGSHEPLADPREKWICDMAAERYAVEFLALQNAPAEKPLVETWDSYPVYRLLRDGRYDWHSVDQLRALSSDAGERRYWTVWWRCMPALLNRLWGFAVVIARLPRHALILAAKLWYRTTAILVRLRSAKHRIWAFVQRRLRAVLKRCPVLKHYLKALLMRNTRVSATLALATEPSKPSTGPTTMSADPTTIPAAGVRRRRDERLRTWLFPRAERWELAFYDLVENHLGTVYRLMQFKWLVSNHFIKVASIYIDYMERHPVKPSIVHCNDLETLLAGYWAKRKYGARLIYDSHEYFSYSDIHAPKYHVRYFQALEQRLVRHCDSFTTVNPVLAAELKKDYGVEVLSVPNAEPWVDGRKLRPEGEITQLASGRVRFLFQGMFAADRGIAELIRAWPQVDGDKAALFLRGTPNRWRDELIEMARELDVLDRSVYFPAAVHVDDLVEAASEADVGLIPYRPIHRAYKFCCPNKLSQYLHAGVMIVSNDLPYVREVLDESGAGLWYRDADSPSIAAAVMRATSDGALRTACRDRAIRYARDVFNWQNYGRIFLDLYEGAPLVTDQREGSGAESADRQSRVQ